jgi:hypothetical protein
MKMFNYINCGLVCLLSASTVYGSNHDRRKAVQETILIYPEAKGLFMGANLCNKDGVYNENANHTNSNRVFVDFFKEIGSGRQLSTDILEIGIFPGKPDSDARDSDGRTVWDYISRFSSSEERYWTNYLKRFFGKSSYGGSSHTRGARARRVTPEEQRRRDLNLALRTAARDGKLKEVKSTLGQGAQINDRGPKSGLTALNHAEAAGHREVASYLRSQGGKRASEL